MTKGGEKVCRLCKRFVTGSVCPVCNTAEFTKSWKGVVYVHDPNVSEVAQILGIKAPGKYCMWLKE